MVWMTAMSDSNNKVLTLGNYAINTDDNSDFKSQRQLKKKKPMTAFAHASNLV